MKRNPLKRVAKTASREQRKKAGPEGLECVQCNPKGGMHRRNHSLDRAMAREMNGHGY